MKMFCKDLKNQAKKIINYEKKEMIPLTNEEKGPYENQKICHICEKNNNKNFVLIKIIKNFKKCKKSEIIVVIQENIEGQLIVSVI